VGASLVDAQLWVGVFAVRRGGGALLLIAGLWALSRRVGLFSSLRLCYVSTDPAQTCIFHSFAWLRPFCILDAAIFYPLVDLTCRNVFGTAGRTTMVLATTDPYQSGSLSALGCLCGVTYLDLA